MVRSNSGAAGAIQNFTSGVFIQTRSRKESPWAALAGPLRRCGARRKRESWSDREAALRGFSLVEIMIAVLILGIALTGMVQGVTTALSASKESELQTVAALFAAGQLEACRAEGDLRDGTTDGECGEGLALYRWQQTVAPAGIDGLHEVSVVVENAKSGKTIFELKTLLFEVPDESRTKSSNTRRESGAQRRRSGAK